MEHDKEDAERIMAEVGAMSRKAIERARSLIKPGVKLLDVAEEVEGFVREGGFGIAFPVNLSVNSEAAHYTPSMEDERAFGENDLVKVDFGAEREGFLGDCALSVDLSGNRGDLVDGAEEALANAIAMVKDGAVARDIGKEIARTIESHGGKPIRNLGGHGVERHNLHAGFFIPNFDDGSSEVLREGMTIAIEPFSTDGRGLVTDGNTCEIFSFAEHAPVRSPTARSVLSEIENRYGSEPFAARWLAGTAGSRFSLYAAMGELVRQGALEQHPTLVEAGNGTVAQAESTVVVEKDGCRILTK